MTKTIASLFEDIGVKDKGKRKTIRAQVLNFFDQKSGCRPNTTKLQQPELRRLLGEYLENTDGRKDFPRDDTGKWAHSCSRTKVLEGLVQIATLWLKGMRKQVAGRSMFSSSNPDTTGKAPARAYQIERMSSTEEQRGESANLADDDLQVFPDFGEHLSENTERRPRDVYNIIPTSEPPLDHNSVRVRDPPITSTKGAHCTPVYSYQSTAGQQAGPSARKRQHQEISPVENEREEETEDDSGNEGLEERPAAPITKRRRLGARPFAQHEAPPKASTDSAAVHQPLIAPSSPNLRRYERGISSSAVATPASPQVTTAALEGSIVQPAVPCEKCVRVRNITLLLLEEQHIKYAMLAIESSNDEQSRNFEAISQIFQSIRRRYERIAAKE